MQKDRKDKEYLSLTECQCKENSDKRCLHCNATSMLDFVSQEVDDFCQKNNVAAIVRKHRNEYFFCTYCGKKKPIKEIDWRGDSSICNLCKQEEEEGE